LNPIIHAEASWLAAQGLRSRRDRVLVTAAGVVPDIDGLTLLAGQEYYETYHHLLTHGFLAALVFSALLMVFAEQKMLVGLLSLVAFHLHLICDLAGSGQEWPIFYFWPINRVEWSWEHGWELASWQNTTIGLLITLACLACALRWRRSFVEVFSVRTDVRVVKTIRWRFLGEPLT